MEFGANAFVHNRSKQILEMYGVDTNKLQKSNEDAQLQKAQENQALQTKEVVVETKPTIVDEAAELRKSEEAVALNLEKEEKANDFNKSLEELMAPISFEVK